MSVRSSPMAARLAAVFTFFWLAGAPGAQPANANAFDLLKGVWRGGGTVSPVGDRQEKVACRVSYGVAGSNVTQSIKCSGSDYSINAVANLRVASGKLSGSWRESTYGVGGGATGSVKSNQVFIRISGKKFSGRMAIKVRGGRHTVNIVQFDAGSGRYSPMASIALHR